MCGFVYTEGSDAEGLDLQHISVLAVTLNRARIQSTPFLTLPNHLALSANAVYHESKIADDIVTDPPRVLIVHSYSERYYWTVDEQTGFVQGLRRWGYDEGEVQVKVFNMDTKQYDARAPAVVRVVLASCLWPARHNTWSWQVLHHCGGQRVDRQRGGHVRRAVQAKGRPAVRRQRTQVLCGAVPGGPFLPGKLHKRDELRVHGRQQ